MKLLITYRDGKTETHIGVEKITPKINFRGQTTAIQCETFLRSVLLERPKAYGNGVAKIEIRF